MKRFSKFIQESLELDEEKKLKFAISKNAKTNGYGIAQWTNYTWWYHSDNTKKYFKTAADAKKYIENVWGKGHTIEINESVNLDEAAFKNDAEFHKNMMKDHDKKSVKGSAEYVRAHSAAANAHKEAAERHHIAHAQLSAGSKDVDYYVKPARELGAHAKKLSDKANKLKESVELDEVSKDTLGRYAAKALNRGDMANRMSKSDNDGMGKIANKRLSGVKKAVDKLADKTGKKALARSIKKDVDTAKASGNSFARGGGVDDQGKSYYKAGRNIGKMREEIELDEVQKLFMFKTKAEADKKAKESNGKVISLTKQNFAVVVEEINEKSKLDNKEK